MPGLAAAVGLTPPDREAITEAFDRLGEEDRLVIAARYLFGLSRLRRGQRALDRLGPRRRAPQRRARTAARQDGGRLMPADQPPRPLSGMSDDRLGTVAVSLVVSELRLDA